MLYESVTMAAWHQAKHEININQRIEEKAAQIAAIENSAASAAAKMSKNNASK